MNYKISVITTLYNCEKFVKESFDSIINQSFKDFEWIVVNDGSTDNTWDIATSYKNDNIVFVNNADNKRIPTRRNEAISYASSPYIAIHDGDDISLPDRLLKQYEFMESCDDKTFCVGGWALQIDENSKEQRVMNYPPCKHKEVVNMLLIERKNPIIDPTSMFKRDIFIKLGEYSLDKEIYTVPDMDLWSRAIINGYKINNISDILIKYRINPKGMTRMFNKEMQKAHNFVWNDFKIKMFKNSNTRG